MGWVENRLWNEGEGRCEMKGRMDVAGDMQVQQLAALDEMV